jgi:hypothetical protein
MNRGYHAGILILIVLVAILVVTLMGQSRYSDSQLDSDRTNLSSFPTSTPRPQVFRFIQEALRRRPRPTAPPVEQE